MGSDEVLPESGETLAAFVAECPEFIDVKDSVVTFTAPIALDGVEVCGQRAGDAEAFLMARTQTRFPGRVGAAGCDAASSHEGEGNRTGVQDSGRQVVS